MGEHISRESCRVWAGVLVFMLILGWMAVPASAQTSGVILGTVKDASGAAVPAANITITNTDTTEARTVTTGDDGAFRAPGLPPGHYSVKVERPSRRLGCPWMWQVSWL